MPLESVLRVHAHWSLATVLVVSIGRNNSQQQRWLVHNEHDSYSYSQHFILQICVAWIVIAVFTLVCNGTVAQCRQWKTVSASEGVVEDGLLRCRSRERVAAERSFAENIVSTAPWDSRQYSTSEARVYFRVSWSLQRVRVTPRGSALQVILTQGLQCFRCELRGTVVLCAPLIYCGVTV